MIRTRPIRVELWRDGELVAEANCNALGVLERELEAQTGDVVYTIWEAHEEMRPMPRPMTVKRVG